MAVRPQPTPRVLAAAPGLAGAGVPAGLTVTGVTLDSRQVLPGDLYAALPGGTTHGARFAAQAIAAGAAAILTDPVGAAAILTDPAGAALLGGCEVPVVVVADPRGLLGELSAWLYGQPGQELTIVGVTGTNGKTTMTQLLAAAWEHAGTRCGVIGTIGVTIAGERLPSARTTPEAPDLHATLAVMRERGVAAVAMEVSSHALALGRVDGLPFDVAVFTNLTQDHLDFHHDMAEYFAAKRRLFDRAGRAVICTDDDWGRTLAAQVPIPVTSYALTGAADWTLRDLRTDSAGRWQATAHGPDGAVALRSRLPGEFNVANTLGALAVLTTLGVPAPAAAAGLAACPGVPGRMEPVGEAPFAALVDYAHSPDAVARAIAAARSFTRGRILVALGCGGDRDAGKRPRMGRVASVGADLLVVTDDNPRSEDPAVIRQAVLSGAREPGARADIEEIPDRRAAIRRLVGRARPGDTILVLGKGHETGQEAHGVVTAFDDRVELAAAIEAAR